MRQTLELGSARRFLERLTLGAPEEKRRFLAAVSGGTDSMCLLCFLLEWSRENGGTVTAAHFHHGLRDGGADRDAAFVRDWCAGRGVPFVMGRGDTRALAKREGLSVEEAARKLRYAFLQRTAAEQGCVWILTAHHADDNAETILLNLCRGTGRKGLCGIPQLRGNIARPFLHISRAELTDYAAAHQIPHVEDETNADPDAAARNLLRWTVLPALRQVNSRAAENMARTAEILEREDEALEQAAEELASAALKTAEGLRISKKRLTEAPAAVAERAVLALLEQACGKRKDLGAVHVDAVLTLARGPRGSGELHFPHRLLVRSEGEALVFCRAAEPPEAAPAALGETVSFGGWHVSLKAAAGLSALPLSERVLEQPLSVTAWKPQDRMTLPGARGGRSLKRLCADAGWTPSQRDGLPVLRVGGVPAAVPGVGIDARFAPESGGRPVYVIFQQNTEESRHEK